MITGRLKVYLNGRQPVYGEEYSKVPRQVLYEAITVLEDQETLIATLRQQIFEITTPPNDLPPAA